MKERRKITFFQNIKISLDSIRLIFMNAKALSIIFLLIEITISVIPFITLITIRTVTNILTSGNIS